MTTRSHLMMEQRHFTTIKPEAGPAPGLELEYLINESDPFDFESAMFQNLVNEGKHGMVRIFPSL